MSIANLSYSVSNANPFSLGFDSQRAQDFSPYFLNFTLPPIQHPYDRPLDFTISVPPNFRFDPIVPVLPTTVSRRPKTTVGPIALGSTKEVKSVATVAKKISSIFKRIYGFDNSASLDALEVTSLFGIGAGLLSVEKGCKDLTAAEQNSDVSGVALARIKIARGALTALKGATYIPTVLISLAMACAPKLEASLKGLRTACSNFTSVFSGVLGVADGMKAVAVAEENSDKTGVLLGRIKEAKGGIAAIQGAAYVPSVAIPYFTKCATTTLNALKGLKVVCTNVGYLFSGVGMGIQSVELWKFRGSLNAILQDPQIAPELRSVRALEFLKQEIVGCPENRASLKRMTSDKCIKMIQQKGPAEANSVIDAIEQELKRKTLLNSLIAIGLALAVLPLVITLSPILLIVADVASLLVSVAWLAVNSHSLYTDLKTGATGEFDKHWILFSSVLAATALSLSVLYSTGVAQLITGLIVSILWLLISATSFYWVDQLENQPCTES